MTDHTRALALAAEMERCHASMSEAPWEAADGPAVLDDECNVVAQCHDVRDIGDGEHNASGIATLRNLAPEVAAELRRLAGEVERLTSQFDASREIAAFNKREAEKIHADRERMRAVVDAAVGSYGSQRGGHFGQPRPTNAMLELADAIDAYRRSKP